MISPRAFNASETPKKEFIWGPTMEDPHRTHMEVELL
jgi:hypothetical protein